MVKKFLCWLLGHNDEHISSVGLGDGDIYSGVRCKRCHRSELRDITRQ